MRQQDTIRRMQGRVELLIEHFDKYVKIFNQKKIYSRALAFIFIPEPWKCYEGTISLLKLF